MLGKNEGAIMSKFKAGNRVVTNGGGSYKPGTKGVVVEFFDEVVRFKTDDGLTLWACKSALDLEVPSLEQMNARVRRDGGEFVVTGWCEQMKMFLGAHKVYDDWCYASWNDKGQYTVGEASVNMDLDLIEKPVVREWTMRQEVDLSLHLNGQTNRQHIRNYWKQEGDNDPELVKVEVVK
jgi:hypothetical protein